MPLAVNDRVQVTATGRTGRVTAVTETQVTVLVVYQAGAVEVAEAFAPEALTLIE